MEREPLENQMELSDKEIEEADRRSAVSVMVVHEAIRGEGEQELRRSSSGLFWSGLAAGYSFGSLLVILGRQQLFTENTLTPILPLMLHFNRVTLRNVLRLWTVVLISNLLGALAISWVLVNTAIFHPEARKAFADIGRESLSATVPEALLRGIFAGWLIAFMVWLLPSAEASRVLVIVALTRLVGVGQLTHVIAGSIGAEPGDQFEDDFVLLADVFLTGWHASELAHRSRACGLALRLQRVDQRSGGGLCWIVHPNA